MPNHLEHLFINDTTLHHVSALKTSLFLSTLLKENLFCFKNQSWMNEMRVSFMEFALFFNQRLPSIIGLCNFKATCQNPRFRNDDCSYNNLFLTWYWHGKISCLPVSMCILDLWVFLLLPQNRKIPENGSPGSQSWCYSLCRLVAAAGVTLPQFPLSSPLGQGWMVPPGASLPRQVYALSSLSLPSPQAPPSTSGLSGGAICGTLAMDSQPSGEDKIRRLSCSLPHPPHLSGSKVALRVKINCLTLPTESILTLSWIAYSSSHYTSAPSSSSS